MVNDSYFRFDDDNRIKYTFSRSSQDNLVSWNYTWWRHQMETFSALLAICAGNSPVPGEFPTQRPVTRSFHVYFDLRPDKRLSKHSWGWWFETLSHSLWRHRNDNPIYWMKDNWENCPNLRHTLGSRYLTSILLVQCLQISMDNDDNEMVQSPNKRSRPAGHNVSDHLQVP